MAKVIDEKMTTKNDVAYLAAFAKCGKASLVSRKRRRHCAKRNQAGSMATIGRIKYELSMHLFVSGDEILTYQSDISNLQSTASTYRPHDAD